MCPFFRVASYFTSILVKRYDYIGHGRKMTGVGGGRCNCEKGISSTKMQGWKLRDMESAGKAGYDTSLTAKYWDFTHVIRYAYTI